MLSTRTSFYVVLYCDICAFCFLDVLVRLSAVADPGFLERGRGGEWSKATRGWGVWNLALEIVHFSVFWVTILCKCHVYNSMERTWTQSPKQSVYDTKKSALPKITRSYRGGRPPPPPPPGSASDCTEPITFLVYVIPRRLVASGVLQVAARLTRVKVTTSCSRIDISQSHTDAVAVPQRWVCTRPSTPRPAASYDRPDHPRCTDHTCTEIYVPI